MSPTDDMPEDQAFIVGVQRNRDLNPIVLNVAARGENEDFLQGVVEVERLGVCGERILVDHGRGRPALAQNRVDENLPFRRVALRGQKFLGRLRPGRIRRQ